MGSLLCKCFLDEAQEKKIQEAGLGDQIIQVEGQEGVKVPVATKSTRSCSSLSGPEVRLV